MKYVILKPNCEKLENHLWNYISIYAYGIETGVPVFNPSFSAWHKYFNLSEKNYVPKIFLSLYGSYLIRARASCTRLTISEVAYLPPTRLFPAHTPVCDTMYFIGWLFRNPVGLTRYREALTTAFTPKESVLKNIDDALAPLRGKQLIGVHLRQQPYPRFEDGSFLVPSTRVRHIVDEYLREKKLHAKDVALVIVSDKEIDPADSGGFTTHISRGNDVLNLFLLSKCSVVIGTNSTFSNLAAWFGNIPHLVATNEPVDWEYYRDKIAYFENRYATFAQ